MNANLALARDRALGLAATAALLAYTLGVPVLLLALNAIPSSSTFRWGALTSPDDGTVALGIVRLGAWIAWAIFAAVVVVEIGARIRGRRAPQLPGLGLPQLAARRLVATAALLFVAAPTSLTFVATPHAAAASPAPTGPHRAPTTPTTAPLAQQPALRPAEPTGGASPQPTTTYVTKRNDSLWKIAEQQLGDGARYPEIYALNKDKLPDGPGFLEIGMHLRIPADAEDKVYVVRPGDTLSQIAQVELGNASAYPKILQASRATLQSDGEYLTNPNLIHPGWALTIPRDHQPAIPTAPTRPTHARTLGPRVLPGDSDPPKVIAPRHGTQITPGRSHAHVDADHGWVTPSWLLPGLAGAGAFLSGSLLLRIGQQRRTQQRYRRPGQRIAPPPPELHDLEKTLQATGSVTAPRIEDLDRILRTLPKHGSEAPPLVYAALTPDQVRIRLAKPAHLETPWSGGDTEWSCSLEAEATDTADYPPYPLLVSVGQDPTGGLVLLNLEELRCIRIGGDPDHAKSLGRHIAAELTLNPWSNLVDIDVLGLGDELADISPGRLHYHNTDDSGFLERLAHDLEKEDPAQEPDQFRAILIASTFAQPDSIRRIEKVITGYQGRPAACVLTFCGESESSEDHLHIASDGALRIRELDLDLVAAGLSEAEARSCAKLIEITALLPNLEPATSEASGTLAEKGGALNPTHTKPRPAGPAGPKSLLPLATQTYEDRAATTSMDIDMLAPCTSADTRRSAHESDPTLEEDLAHWHSPTAHVPKLTLLGPVKARTPGDARKTAHRRAYYLEVLAYLTLHTDGVTATQMAEDFGIRPERARNDISIVRTWLGNDLATGDPYLPNARQTYTTGSSAKYKVTGVLTDLDLFRRLRIRGQAKGATGIADLERALKLVSGEPFSDLRDTGWTWLLDGDRLDHIMTCAIADVAHIVTTHALGVEDLKLARFAAEVGYLGAPYDESMELDLVAVASQCGDHDEASSHLRRGVFNRADDHRGPIDLPMRSAKIIDRRRRAVSRDSTR